MKLLLIYERLLTAFGPQHWWPADTPFEMMAGAILTQSCAWTNVEKALANLKRAGILSPEAICRLSYEELSVLIRPSGYYNAKARKLKCLSAWFLTRCGGDPARLAAVPDLRKELLDVHGVGPETADSIVLYAAGKPVFVIDAYTRRIATRLGLAPDATGYDTLQKLFMTGLPPDASLYNEFHALLVRLGKDFCQKKPSPARLCFACPLTELCRFHAENYPALSRK